MSGHSRFERGIRFAGLLIAAFAFVSWPAPSRAATKTVDLDGQSANGAESKCDLNVLATFPVKVENVVTNKAVGDVFNFNWASAGPGGFVSSATAGTTGGVGAKWTWTTNQTVYSFTGATCEKDICFFQTQGTDVPQSKCSLACLNDGVTVTVSKGANTGEVVLSWSGGAGSYTVYRSSSGRGIDDPANTIATTDLLSYTDVPPGGMIYYHVRGTTCNQPKPCQSDADCSPATAEGTCVSRGPFAVPGRSLTSSDVTVSSASLTSSLITFFSPPKEVFRATSTAQPGTYQETLTNASTQPVTVTTEEFPPGCCPANPAVPHQLKCGETCVDYLNDPNNCGACGNVCGDGTCCSNGACVSLCAEGQVWCGGQCVDLANDNANCGTCGQGCGDGTCCGGGTCNSLCEAGQTWCGSQCADLQNDSNNCGACGNVCGEGSCCNAGVCANECPAGQTFANGKCYDLQNDNLNCGAIGNVCGAGSCCSAGACYYECPAGQTFAGGQCYDLQNDNNNCGSIGNVCGAGTCCSGGVCASVCAAGQTWCNGQCVDLQNDSSSCGACGNVCGEGTCCNTGTCASVCEAGRTLCGSLCYDLQNDPGNCGACGNVCDGDSVCTGGACVPCSGHSGTKDACDNRCVNLNTDPYNCGACGVSCNMSCPSGFTGVCSNGQSCRCEAGTPAPQPPSNIPPPTAPFCPNPHPTTPVPGVCPNPTPSGGPIAAYCPNPAPKNGAETAVCSNPHPSPGPVNGVCSNQNPTYPVPGACPTAETPTTSPNEAPVCQLEASTSTIPPGGSSTTCQPGGILFKEIPSTILACGDSLPGPDGSCANGVTHVSRGTFMRLVPDTSKTAGAAYITPYAVHVSDASGDGLLQPGENANLVIDVLNAGTANVSGASATLVAPTVDITDDGVTNPVGITVVAGNSTYGTIQGTQATIDCTPPTLHPASNSPVYQVTVPPGHPGDTAHPFTLNVTGTVNGTPFSMSVPMSLGIAHTCDYAAALRDYDGLDGLLSPLTKLVPEGDPVPFPSKALNAGKTAPLKMRLLCGGVNLRGADADAPQIVGLSEATRGPIDITLLNLNDDTNSNDPFFRWNDTTKQWIYNMRTSQLGTGVFTIKIRVANRKDYVSGFELR